MPEKAPWPDSTPEEDAAYALQAQWWNMEFQRDVVEQGGPQVAEYVDPERARLLPTELYTVQGLYRPEDQDKSIMEIKRYAPLAREIEEKGIEPPGRDVAAVVGGGSATPQIWAHEFGHRRISQKGGRNDERWRLIHDGFRSDTPTEWVDAVKRWLSWNRKKFNADPEMSTYKDVEENLKRSIAANSKFLINAEVEAREAQHDVPKKREGFFTIESLRKDQEEQMERRSKSWSVEKYNENIKRTLKHIDDIRKEQEEQKASGGKVTMPSKTPKQAKFMRAIAHGWTPSRTKNPPSRAVAQEFVNADRKYSGGFAENRYWTGGLAAMDEITAGGKRGSLDLFKWQRGGRAVDSSDEGSEYREQLRKHQEKIAAILGSARGGHVNYYQKGGAVRPGHAEDVGERGPNPHDPVKEPAAYKYWETRFHKDPPPPKVAEEEPEDVPWYMKLAGYGSEKSAEEVDIAVTEAEKGEAYGGRVNYQAGGLAIAAPAGGVPPWISPTGSGPGYMDEPPPGYQFGGIANRFNPPAAGPATAQPYRGVPPQRGGIQRGVMGEQYDPGGSRPLPPGGIPNDFPGGGGGVGLSPYEEMENRMRGPRGPMAPGGGGGPLQLPIMDRPNPNIGRPGYDPIGDMGPITGRGAPPGGGRGFLGGQRGFMGMAARGEMGPGTTTRYINGMPEGGGPAPTGALAQAIRRSQEWQQQQAGGAQPGGGGFIGRMRQLAQPDGGVMGEQYDPGGSRPLPPGGIPNDFPGLDPYSEGELKRRGPRGPMAPGGGGGPLQLPIMDRPNPNIGRPGYDPIGDMGPITGPGTRPGKLGPGTFPPRMVPPSPPGGGGYGRPGGVPGTIGGYGGYQGGGEGIPGGPRVPPNLRGYLQRQRMMNRPPRGPVSGGGNRVGMADQQGALSRALQRGTGRPPMSRRMGFGRAGPTR